MPGLGPLGVTGEVERGRVLDPAPLPRVDPSESEGWIAPPQGLHFDEDDAVPFAGDEIDLAGSKADIASEDRQALLAEVARGPSLSGVAERERTQPRERSAQGPEAAGDGIAQSPADRPDGADPDQTSSETGSLGASASTTSAGLSRRSFTFVALPTRWRR